MKKRSFLVASLAICLAAILAVGSMAYFTNEKEVAHKFMTGIYDPENPDNPVEPDKLFSIKLFETNDVGEEIESGKEYNDIAPGNIMDKDPTVRNTGEYGEWVRVNITMNKATTWNAIMTKHTIIDLGDALLMNLDTAVWDKGPVTTDEDKDTITMVYYLKAELVKDATATLFTKVNIPSKLDSDDMASLNSFDLKLTADAIQYVNTGNTAQEAFSKYWN